jgi:hypothetical protein
MITPYKLEVLVIEFVVVSLPTSPVAQPRTTCKLAESNVLELQICFWVKLKFVHQVLPLSGETTGT